MKIFFNGDSVTWGAELEGLNSEDADKIRKEKRFSTIMGNQLDAEVINISNSGVSNDWIVEKTMTWFSTNNADLAVIQFTEPSRWIWYDSQNVERLMCIHKTMRNVKRGRPAGRPEERIACSIYYRSIYTDLMGLQNQWKNQYMLETFFKLKNIPYIFCQLKSHHFDQKIEECNWKRLCENKNLTNLMFSKGILGCADKNPENYCPDLGVGNLRGGHPSAIGHQKISEKLIDLYNLVGV